MVLEHVEREVGVEEALVGFDQQPFALLVRQALPPRLQARHLDFNGQHGAPESFGNVADVVSLVQQPPAGVYLQVAI